jgi:hypothetical protein
LNRAVAGGLREGGEVVGGEGNSRDGGGGGEGNRRNGDGGNVVCGGCSWLLRDAPVTLSCIMDSHNGDGGEDGDVGGGGDECSGCSWSLRSAPFTLSCTMTWLLRM